MSKMCTPPSRVIQVDIGNRAAFQSDFLAIGEIDLLFGGIEDRQRQTIGLGAIAGCPAARLGSRHLEFR